MSIRRLCAVLIVAVCAACAPRIPATIAPVSVVVTDTPQPTSTPTLCYRISAVPTAETGAVRIAVCEDGEYRYRLSHPEREIAFGSATAENGFIEIGNLPPGKWDLSIVPAGQSDPFAMAQTCYVSSGMTTVLYYWCRKEE